MAAFFRSLRHQLPPSSIDAGRRLYSFIHRMERPYALLFASEFNVALGKYTLLTFALPNGTDDDQ